MKFASIVGASARIVGREKLQPEIVTDEKDRMELPVIADKPRQARQRRPGDNHNHGAPRTQ